MWCSSDLNRCPCGNYGDPLKPCVCSESAVARYQHRLSGPLLDRIDIFIEVPRIEFDKLSSMTPAESSENVRERVQGTRSLQDRRFSETMTQSNADMTPAEVRDFCQVSLDDQS